MSADHTKLMPLTGKARRRDFLVLDLESKRDFSQEAGFTRPFMCGVYDGLHYYAFFDREPATSDDWEEHYFREGGCVDRMMRFLLRKQYRGKHIYAHNAGRFDYLFILPWLMHIGTKLGFEFSVIPVASSIQVLDVWRASSSGHARRKSLWRFVDSLKLIPTSLDKAAKGFGLKGKDKSALNEDLDTPETDRKAWIAYNNVDCVQLFQVLERFHHYVENVLLGEVGITAPATAMKIFRRRFLKDAIPRSVDTHAFIRESYKGGRTENYIRKGKGLYYFDINSSYAAAMLEDMPAGEATWWEGDPEAFIRDGYIGFCEVDVWVPPSLNIPPLPITKGKLIFPVGKLTGTWEWSELALALEVGCQIVRWGKSVWYPPKPIFRGYVVELYKYRDKSRADHDQGLDDVVKIMLNSLYGKFGMKTLRKKIYLATDPELPENAVPANGDPDCPVWYAETESDAPYVMPQISARVTSLGRQRLYRGVLAVEKAGGDVYYSDTDSIITDVRIPTSTELGAFKDELPEWGGRLEGEFVAPKLYALTAPGFEKIKAKGIPSKKNKDGKEIMKTLENFYKLSRGEKLELERLEKVGTLAQAGFQRGPRMRMVPRKFLAEDAKRVMHKDGTSSPIRLDMW